MRDPKLWAQDIKAKDIIDLDRHSEELIACGEGYFPDVDRLGLEDVIRAAQEDGAEEWRERAKRAEDSLRAVRRILKGRLNDIENIREADDHYYIEGIEKETGMRS